MPYLSKPRHGRKKRAASRISQVIIVQREGQKKIVIGDKGAMIKDIGISARRELEKLLGKRVPSRPVRQGQAGLEGRCGKLPAAGA